MFHFLREVWRSFWMLTTDNYFIVLRLNKISVESVADSAIKFDPVARAAKTEDRIYDCQFVVWKWQSLSPKCLLVITAQNIRNYINQVYAWYYRELTVGGVRLFCYQTIHTVVQHRQLPAERSMSVYNLSPAWSPCFRVSIYIQLNSLSRKFCLQISSCLLSSMKAVTKQEPNIVSFVAGTSFE